MLPEVPEPHRGIHAGGDRHRVVVQDGAGPGRLHHIAFATDTRADILRAALDEPA